jgi:hypothetical protein
MGLYRLKSSNDEIGLIVAAKCTEKDQGMD